MDYCGVEYTAVESAGGSSWKWQLLISETDTLKSSGEAASRAAAIDQAHEAIGEGLRANAVADHAVPSWQLVHDVLQVLHGARSLPATDAIAALRPFVNAMRDRNLGSDGLADASAAAVRALVRRLEANGIASDDLWEVAIEASVSFANEANEPGALPTRS
jgi:hypothetical protein